MILEGNYKVRNELLRTIQPLTDEEFNKIPEDGGWSPKQIFEHLELMESIVAKNIAKELKNPNSPKAMKKPIIVSTNRLIKIEAPSYTAPSNDYKTIEEMKIALYNSRIFLLDIYELSTKEVFREKSFKHPVFGDVPLIQWFSFVGLHEKRHLKQLKETIGIN
ncbi:DinB family protein [Sporosarcina sp. CAU 1771]